MAKILLRPCYTELWDLVCEGKESNNFIITGTPGAGKTVWQYYVMYHLATAGDTAVVDFKGSSQDSVRMGPLTAFDKELQQKTTWYLVDTREPEEVAAKTILTSSPKREIFKDFAKAGAATLYMPVWSWLELDAGRHLHELREDEILPPCMRSGAGQRGWKEFNDVCGKLFEPLAHRILRGGGVFDVWDLEMGTQTTLDLPPCTSIYTFHDLKDVADQEAGTYCIPSRSDQAAIDSIQQPQWRKKQEYTGRTDLKVLRAVKQRVIKVPLKVMAHSLRTFRAV
ncbi:hypothetical protein COCSUDRAFT_55086 [Coccomyxa subellipsoidea C-169]|uniref:Uncharacterized protein n=1 Tax=Coccomyxa subellipsoidea (strain C-169) TaxID=574566 RepID=I0Z8U1_COCSC|nr:hypothetical protein COCSUDRAFT_55086 [Coccomyxa subellipsoidea C-169]EIE27060.1 hypothetical protein COCSUDRAFT_55086 [Coccomyxa subellipsoidea C-169]|eukprot:XP_005651604.1 hypothetical protein COCSUDRAFT_55086 [Coccomyxa subellipsoidea C-169]